MYLFKTSKLAGTVVEETRPVSYRVQAREMLWKRHMYQIRGSYLPVSRGVGLAECACINTRWCCHLESGDKANPLVAIERNIIEDEGVEQQIVRRNGDVPDQRYPTRNRQTLARYGHDKEEEV